MPILALLLLLAPEDTYELKLRFEKGMSYEEASTRHVALKLVQSNRVLKFDKEDSCVLKRTVVEVGADGLPAAETVVVVKSEVNVKETADGNEKPGVTTRPSQGKTLAWRRGKKGEFGLFEGDTDVSVNHPDIVQRMKTGGSARLPAHPVAVGGTWEVTALDMVQSDGKAPPEGLEGKAVFKLEEVKDGVARISFELNLSHKRDGSSVSETGKGLWLLDLKNGRELKLEAEGPIGITKEKSQGGFGAQKMTREITYPQRSS